MQRSYVFQKKYLFLLPFFSIFFIIVSISSCNNSDNKGLTGPANCFTITRSEISTNMLSAGWSDPTNNDFIPYLYFYPSNASGDTRVIAYPADKDNNLYTSRKVSITPPAMDPPCSFPANLTIVPNRYDFSTRGFADPKGRLIPFDFLRLRPRACTEEGYTMDMVFDVYAVTSTSDGGETEMYMGYTKPCPPYCPVQ